MKKPLLALLFLALSAPLYAQSSGPVHKFTHSAFGGYRTKRQYLLGVQYKPAKDGDQLGDTVIGYFMKEDPKAEISEKDYFVRAYPNPIHDVLYIENLSWKEGDIAEFKVTDALGKQILSTRTALSKDNIRFNAAIVAGSYHVHYYLNGVFLISWQIVKL